MNYTNPRVEAVIENWPLGGNKRGKVMFQVERVPGKGQRACRTSYDPRTGKASAPKRLTYAREVRIVDGDDGRTYLAELTAYGFIAIMRGDMKFQHESIFPDNPRYAMARELFKELPQ